MIGRGRRRHVHDGVDGREDDQGLRARDHRRAPRDEVPEVHRAGELAREREVLPGHDLDATGDQRGRNGSDFPN